MKRQKGREATVWGEVIKRDVSAKNYYFAHYYLAKGEAKYF